jgi:predicted RNA-binding protein
MSKKFVCVTAIIMAVIAELHMLRVFFPIPIVIGALSLPLWASVLVYIGAGTISAYLFRAWVKLSAGT